MSWSTDRRLITNALIGALFTLLATVLGWQAMRMQTQIDNNHEAIATQSSNEAVIQSQLKDLTKHVAIIEDDVKKLLSHRNDPTP